MKTLQLFDGELKVICMQLLQGRARHSFVWPLLSGNPLSLSGTLPLEGDLHVRSVVQPQIRLKNSNGSPTVVQSKDSQRWPHTISPDKPEARRTISGTPWQFSTAAMITPVTPDYGNWCQKSGGCTTKCFHHVHQCPYDDISSCTWDPSHFPWSLIFMFIALIHLFSPAEIDSRYWCFLIMGSSILAWVLYIFKYMVYKAVICERILLSFQVKIFLRDVVEYGDMVFWAQKKRILRFHCYHQGICLIMMNWKAEWKKHCINFMCN